MMPGNSIYEGFELQGSTMPRRQQIPHHQSHPRQGQIVHPAIHDKFSLRIGTTAQDIGQNISLADYNSGERDKAGRDEDEPNFIEDTGDGYNEPNKGRKAPFWHRVKWTDQMVRLLITAVSYIGEESAAENGGTRRCSNMQKKGKWKLVSKVIAERGHFVSPQQCEDKFNDLNKRYKRLNEILGRGTSCEVVENPALLEMMDHVSKREKEEVRKILSSKHLHYEEMCSYHNGNRLHLPPDPELLRSLRLADHNDNDVTRYPDNDDEDDHEAELEDHDVDGDNYPSLPGEHRVYGIPGGSAKRTKQCQGHEDATFATSLISLNCNRTFSSQPQNANITNQMISEGLKANVLQKQWMDQSSLQLEEQKLQIQAEMLELEKERFKWQRFRRKKDTELEVMRMKNERMKLENERMALELKRKQMLADIF